MPARPRPARPEPARRSAGVVLVRRGSGPSIEVLLVHPGGPFWARKDLGAWSIPKGEYESDEDPRTAALREFREELGVDCPAVELTELGEITQSGGKRVVAWCGMGTIDTSTVVSNTFEMEWPPRSGVMRAFPEVDRAEFFAVDVALDRVVPGQRPLIERAAQWVADTDR